jgi:hypothetical protein
MPNIQDRNQRDENYYRADNGDNNRDENTSATSRRWRCPRDKKEAHWHGQQRRKKKEVRPIPVIVNAKEKSEKNERRKHQPYDKSLHVFPPIDQAQPQPPAVDSAWNSDNRISFVGQN